MLQRISFNGSTFVDCADMELHERVVFLVDAEVAAVTQTGNKSQGDFEVRPLSIVGAIRLEGVEGREALARVSAELDKADAATVNGGSAG